MQGQFIEETIRSVLLQGYPRLEYLVIDGGSTDSSVEVIRKYEPWLTAWVSQKDSGQVDAIDKGLRLCSGELFNWINSDDLLLQGALGRLGERFRRNAVAAPILEGPNLATATKRANCRLSFDNLLNDRCVYSQPGFWLPRQALQSIGFNKLLHYAFDWQVALRYLREHPGVEYIREPVAFFRLHESSKTIRSQTAFRREGIAILSELCRTLPDAGDRRAVQKTLRRVLWHRLLSQWSANSKQRQHLALRMLLLGLRKPVTRLDRFWLGALRRQLLNRPPKAQLQITG